MILTFWISLIPPLLQVLAILDLPRAGYTHDVAATITVFRPMGFFGVVRNLDVHIDGEPVGKLKVTETGTYEVAPGEHEVFVSMEVFQSLPLPVTVEDGETYAIEVNHPSFFGSYTKVNFAPNTLFVLKPKQQA